VTPEPIATYRLQLHPGFTLDDAAAVVPYLARLGVSHVYLSPFLQATEGSTHGYDVVDPSRVNRELGGEVARRRLVDAAAAAGLGQVLDVVPNHMAVAGDQNPWWWDVLENGPSSRYALYFDVDWDASEERWPNKVLLPVLGDHYGRVLEAGELALHYADGLFTLHHQGNRFPLDMSSLAGPLQRAYGASGVELLGFLAESCARLPRPQVTARRELARRRRDQDVIQRLLDDVCRADPVAAGAVGDEVARINADPDALDALIDLQNYRLAWWRTAGRELGYRRFFDIHDLAGLRVEEDEVFRAIHDLPLRWAAEGAVQGLRIDHPDGLRDPGQYFRRLRAALPEAWIVVEKILERGERLPEDWPVAGTTGYDFLHRVQDLFVDPTGEAPLTRLFAEFAGEEVDFDEVVHDGKRQVLREMLGSELHRLTSLFVAICERHRRYRDYTRDELRQALLEVAACFPVYRTYLTAGAAPSDSDVGHVDAAVAAAALRWPDADPDLLGFLHDLLLLRVPGALETELALRFQQLTGPAMAKGVEDTAFYRYHRLVALNEVGGDPGAFGRSLRDFHDASRATLASHPRTMLATSTHDTKRSEDVRARLLLLSEVPDDWGAAVRGWLRATAPHRRGDLPDPATLYLFFQTLVGAWPIDVERMTAYLEKAVREAKAHTSWTHPDEAYEGALRGFAAGAMADAGFMADVERFVRRLVAPGRTNALAQTLIKLTAPGVPDLYQGTETWDLSLVDPDNRRPVDFEGRLRALDELERASLSEIVARADEGLPKTWVVRQALALRRRHPHWFGPDGAYEPLWAAGPKSDHVVAYGRGGGALVVVPRLVMGLAGGWGDTSLTLPAGRWRDALSGREVEGGSCGVADLLADFPVALLERVDG
jgi:(1->4)-alpha-D-glucan 1-alpha-D-glucosylmutase